jgi:hypothetical protein
MPFSSLVCGDFTSVRLSGDLNVWTWLVLIFVFRQIIRPDAMFPQNRYGFVLQLNGFLFLSIPLNFFGFTRGLSWDRLNWKLFNLLRRRRSFTVVSFQSGVGSVPGSSNVPGGSTDHPPGSLPKGPVMPGPKMIGPKSGGACGPRSCGGTSLSAGAPAIVVGFTDELVRCTFSEAGRASTKADVGVFQFRLIVTASGCGRPHAARDNADCFDQQPLARTSAAE